MPLPFGEVVLIRMQFHQAADAKVRPAVVLLDTGDDDFVAAPITSQNKHSEYDLAIHEWQSAGLNAASYIRVHKLTVLAKSEIVRRLRSADCTRSRAARLASLPSILLDREAGSAGPIDLTQPLQRSDPSEQQDPLTTVRG